VHDLHDLGALVVDQIQQLVLDALVALGRDVVLAAGGQWRQSADVIIVVAVRFFGESLAHEADLHTDPGLIRPGLVKARKRKSLRTLQF
jgi:hypothetical protein